MKVGRPDENGWMFEIYGTLGVLYARRIRASRASVRSTATTKPPAAAMARSTGSSA
jgi:hypothetical protein